MVANLRKMTPKYCGYKKNNHKNKFPRGKVSNIFLEFPNVYRFIENETRSELHANHAGKFTRAQKNVNGFIARYMNGKNCWQHEISHLQNVTQAGH